MKKLYITLFLLIPLFSIAQSNYKPGYVVNLKGDTLRGLINYREWDYTPKNIDFKTTEGDRARQLGTNDISCFNVDGLDSYKRYTVKVSLAANTLRNAPTGIDTTTKAETVFLRVLQAGQNVTLYSYTDAVKSRYYIQDNTSDVPRELIYLAYLDPENPLSLITIDTYHRQLVTVAVNLKLDLSVMQRFIQRAAYRETDLLEVVSKINGVSANKASEKSAGYKHRFFAGIALAANTLSYDGQNPFPNQTSSTSVSPKVTFGFDDFLNPQIGRLIIRLEVSFTVSNFNFNSVVVKPYGIPTDSTMSQVKQITTAFTPQLIYNIYNAGNFKVFLDAGLAFNLSSYPTNLFNERVGGIKTTVNNFPALESLYLTLPLKAGIVLTKKLEIYGSFYPRIGLTQVYNYSGGIGTIQGGINYLIGKTANKQGQN